MKDKRTMNSTTTLAMATDTTTTMMNIILSTVSLNTTQFLNDTINTTISTTLRKRRRSSNRMSPNEITLLITLFALVSIIGVFGNTIVIYVYGFAARKRFLKFERLMLILGIVDLLASITNPLVYIYNIYFNYRAWHFGEIACKILPVLGPTSTSISLGIILIMAIDRDRAVCTPFKEQFTVKAIYKAVSFTVILSIALSLPYIHFQKLYLGRFCGLHSKIAIPYTKYALPVFMISDICFVLILGITTVRVFRKLTEKSALTYPRTKKFRARETRRILKIITAMGVCFIVFIFPRDIQQIAFLYTYLHPPILKIPNRMFVNAILKVIHTSNSSVNVFLYSLLNPRFRREILRIVMKSTYIRQWFGYITDIDTSFSETRTTRKSSSYHQSRSLKSIGRMPLERIPLGSPLGSPLGTPMETPIGSPDNDRKITDINYKLSQTDEF